MLDPKIGTDARKGEGFDRVLPLNRDKLAGRRRPARLTPLR